MCEQDIIIKTSCNGVLSNVWLYNHNYILLEGGGRGRGRERGRERGMGERESYYVL